MILADEYLAHPATPAAGSYEFYSLLGALYVMFSDGIPLALKVTSGLIIDVFSSDFTVINQDIIKSIGPGPTLATLPSAIGYRKIITIKHIGAADLTIQTVLGQDIDGNATLQLRGGKKNSVSLFSDGANWNII